MSSNNKSSFIVKIIKIVLIVIGFGACSFMLISRNNNTNIKPCPGLLGISAKPKDTNIMPQHICNTSCEH